MQNEDKADVSSMFSVFAGTVLCTNRVLFQWPLDSRAVNQIKCLGIDVGKVEHIDCTK